MADLGFEVSEFKIPQGDLERIMTSGNYPTGETHYSKDRHVPRPLLLAKLTAVLTYFSVQGSAGAEKRRIGFNPGGGGP